MQQNIQKTIKYWLNGSAKDFEAAERLFENKLYPQSLFFYHLSVEKILKAVVMKRTGKMPPFIHDLHRLAEIAKIKLTKDREEILEKIFTFNITGRYADEKFEFYRKYNDKEFAEKYLKITEELLLWLKEEFQKK